MLPGDASPQNQLNPHREAIATNPSLIFGRAAMLRAVLGCALLLGACALLPPAQAAAEHTFEGVDSFAICSPFTVTLRPSSAEGQTRITVSPEDAVAVQQLNATVSISTTQDWTSADIVEITIETPAAQDLVVALTGGARACAHVGRQPRARSSSTRGTCTVPVLAQLL